MSNQFVEGVDALVREDISRVLGNVTVDGAFIEPRKSLDGLCKRSISGNIHIRNNACHHSDNLGNAVENLGYIKVKHIGTVRAHLCAGEQEGFAERGKQTANQTVGFKRYACIAERYSGITVLHRESVNVCRKEGEQIVKNLTDGSTVYLDIVAVACCGIDEVVISDFLISKTEQSAVVGGIHIGLHDFERECELAVVSLVCLIEPGNDRSHYLTGCGRNKGTGRPVIVVIIVVIVVLVARDEQHTAGQAQNKSGYNEQESLFLHNLLLIINSAPKKPSFNLHNNCRRGAQNEISQQKFILY